MFIHFRRIILAAFTLSLAQLGNGHAGTTGLDYALVDTLHFPGPTRWDYLTFDSKEHRLFITRGERVDVLDVKTKKIVGSIPDTSGVHGVALAPELSKGFISNGTANTVIVFDFNTLKSLATVQVGTKPDAIAYDAATQRVFSANAGSGDITVINAKDGTVIATIMLDGQPEFAVVDGKGRLYVNLEDKAQLAVVDTKNLKVIAHYNLAQNCESPTGLAIDTSLDRLFAVCRSKVMVVIDAVTGKIKDTLPIGASSDAAIFDPETKRVFSSNGEGSLTVVDASPPDHYQVVQTVATMPTARTMALDPLTHQLYLAAAETNGFDQPTAKHPHPRPHIKPETFMILTVGQK